jgi:hypothetical protein
VWHRTRRYLRLKRADVCLVSYPKAGRTWLRLLIGRALSETFGLDAENPMEVEDFADLDRRIPRILVTHDGLPLRPAPFEVRWDKSGYRRKSVVLLVRDPRDVVVSSYFHANRRDRSYPGTLAEYVREPRGGIDTVLAFHQSWRDNLHVPARLTVVRYEDLSRDAESELARVLRFIGISGVTAAALRSATRYGSFENMQELERRAAFGRGRLEPTDVADEGSFKVRRGKVGGYRDYLDPSTVDYLDRKLSSARLEVFGYG